jgi:GNAT superfamily N-acetyltransferase
MKPFLQFFLEYIESEYKESPSKMFGDDGVRISIGNSYIEIKHSNVDFSPRKQSVVDFVVDPTMRNKGVGTKLLDIAKTRYDDLGGQVSSPASLNVFFKHGFRNPKNPTASFEEHLKMFRGDGESIFMAMNDNHGKPYTD